MKNYIKESLLKEYYNRDADNYSIGIGQNYSYMQKHIIKLDYKYSIENAAGKDFGFDSHLFSGSLRSDLPDFTIDISGGYEFIYYKNLNSVINFRKSRIDENGFAAIGVSKNLGKSFLMDFQYRYLLNISNINLYEYFRNTYMLSLKWNY